MAGNEAHQRPEDTEVTTDADRRRRLVMARTILWASKGRSAKWISKTLRDSGDLIGPARNIEALLEGWARSKAIEGTILDRLDFASRFQPDPPPDDPQDAIFVDCRDPNGGPPMRLRLEPYLLPKSWDPPDKRDARSWFSRVGTRLCIRAEDRRYADIDLETQEGVIMSRSQAQSWFPAHGRARDLPDDLWEVTIDPAPTGAPEGDRIDPGLPPERELAAADASGSKADGLVQPHRKAMNAYILGGANLTTVDSGIEFLPIVLNEFCRVVTEWEAIKLLRRAGKGIQPELAASPPNKLPDRGSGCDGSGDDESLKRIAIDGNRATVEGVVHVLDDCESAFLRGLVNAGPGHWIAGSKMEALVLPRPDRIYAKMRTKYPWVKAFIEAKAGKGFRLKPDAATPGNANIRP
jgi:hypothetical protein